MLKSVKIDAATLMQVCAETQMASSEDAVRMALESYLRHQACLRLIGFFGSEPDAEPVPRRREAPAKRRKAA